jgi:hypothetical protein
MHPDVYIINIYSMKELGLRHVVSLKRQALHSI